MIKLFWFLPILGSRAAGSLFPGCLCPQHFPSWKAGIPLQLLSFAPRRMFCRWGCPYTCSWVLIKPNPKRAGGHGEQGEPARSRGCAASAEAAGSAERRRRARDRKDCPGWILLISLWFICACNSFFCRVCSNSAW